MDAVIARHQAFRAVLGALAMPGTRHPIPGAGPLALVLDAVYVDPDAAIASGDIVIVDSELMPAQLAAAKRGEEITPEGGATIYLRIDEHTPWTRASLTGPGINGTAHIEVPFTSAVLEARALVCAEFPRGVDIITIDRDAQVLAFPRTTLIEAA
jgi:phosphonate C-P lyase system protein PhnH